MLLRPGHRLVGWGLVAAWLVLWTGVRPAHAQVVIPPGFHLLRAGSGVQMYIKQYPAGTPDYVQIIDLSQGARLRLLHGPIVDPGVGKGTFGGPNPRFQRQTLDFFWKQLQTSDPGKAFCVVNGGFFYLNEQPGFLSYPLKVDGRMVTEGYPSDLYAGHKIFLELWSDQALIRPLTSEDLYTSTAADIQGGLSEAANKRANKYVPRTFIGLADQDGNGRYEILLVFNTQTARQVDAVQVLHDFGAAQVMMLDGGGSTQLWCDDQSLIASDRPIPQAVGIVAAAPLPTHTPTATLPPTTTPTRQPGSATATPSVLKSQTEAVARSSATPLPRIPTRPTPNPVLPLPAATPTLTGPSPERPTVTLPPVANPVTRRPARITQTSTRPAALRLTPVLGSPRPLQPSITPSGRPVTPPAEMPWGGIVCIPLFTVSAGCLVLWLARRRTS